MFLFKLCPATRMNYLLVVPLPRMHRPTSAVVVISTLGASDYSVEVPTMNAYMEGQS